MKWGEKKNWIYTHLLYLYAYLLQYRFWNISIKERYISILDKRNKQVISIRKKMGRYSRSKSRSRSRDGGGGGDEEGFRIHVADLGVDCSQREIEKTFGKFGEIKEVWLARNPPCFAFVVFKRRGDAEDSIREIDGRVVCGSRVRCSWARPRTRGRPPVGRNDDSFRCYQCGEKGHFSRDCRNTRGSGAGYRSSGGGGGRRGYDDDYRRSKPARRLISYFILHPSFCSLMSRLSLSFFRFIFLLY